MKFAFQMNEYKPDAPMRIGNVYPTRGGTRVARGDFWILAGISECGQSAYLLAVNRDGRICGVSSYGTHVVKDWSPVAFATGLEDMTFDVVSV